MEMNCKHANQLIGCCGLDCEVCDARIATLTNDTTLREKTAALWTKLNGVPITPEMIHCTGCRAEGAKTPFCDKLCPVHHCVREKSLDACADCGQMDGCQTLGRIAANSPFVLENLKRLKEGRNQAEVDKALAAITECVKTGKGNLLELAVEAAHVRATLGEISDACETIVGRYKAVIRTISGVYSSESKKDTDFAKACELTEEFAKKEGRRPRIMIAKMGQDGHDRGAKVVATGYADCGFDVDMGPLFQTPAEAARDAVENDVHVVGVSSLAAGHKTLIPQIIEELKKLGREDILVIAGGVIPAQDYDFLYKAGVVAIFGPGTSVAKAAVQIMNILLDEEE